mmetsp:Transcript_35478/g.84980  ORF Transcript_35478/g.84980 Transcript_35478/m.84980 type:complete len:234 (+) Transcript_35478:1544-2245(+)
MASSPRRPSSAMSTIPSSSSCGSSHSLSSESKSISGSSTMFIIRALVQSSMRSHGETGVLLVSCRLASGSSVLSASESSLPTSSASWRWTSTSQAAAMSSTRCFNPSSMSSQLGPSGTSFGMLAFLEQESQRAALLTGSSSLGRLSLRLIMKHFDCSCCTDSASSEPTVTRTGPLPKAGPERSGSFQDSGGRRFRCRKGFMSEPEYFPTCEETFSWRWILGIEGTGSVSWAVK